MMNQTLVVLFFSSAVLAAPFSDGWQVMALWHMDQTVSVTSPYSETVDAIADDDSVFINRNNDLILGRRHSGGSGTTYDPTLVAGVYGNALGFDGDDHAYAYTGWNETNAVRIEFDFKPEDGTISQTMATVTNSWWIRTGFNTGGTSGKVDFYVYDGGAAKLAASYFVPIAQYLNNWHHVVAQVDAAGNVTCELVGATEGDNVVTTVSGIDDSHHPTIHLGGRWTNTEQYQGAIDEMKITDLLAELPAFTSPYEDDAVTQILLHCNEILETSPRTTPDDDSANSGRDKDATLLPSSSPDDPYNGPALVASTVDANSFGNCFEFDGLRGMRLEGDTDEHDVDGSNFRLECWAKVDEEKTNLGIRYDLIYQASRYRLSIEDQSSGQWGICFATWDASSTADTANYIITDPTEWTHYACEFLDGQMTLIVNGNIVAQKTVAWTTIGGAIRPLHFGQDHVGNNKLIGKMDEIRFSRAQVSCGDWGYLPGDISGPSGVPDCYVDHYDLEAFISVWLDSTLP